jgi:membrane protein DedA with SNARE-associated domain
VSRFLPGVRAVVPPIAGAMDVGAVRALIAMALASGAWYGLVCVLAFHAGANADALLERIAGQQKTLGLGAAAMVLVAVAVMWWRAQGRRR